MSLDLDTAFQELQRILKRHPVLVVGTGASCALDPRFGMEALAKELPERIHLEAGREAQQWNGVLEELKAHRTLEEALDAVTEKGLVNRIVAATGAFVAKVDGEWAWRVATGTTAPLNGLLRKLVHGLPPTNPLQHVVTPNYDMLVEHTCGALGVPYTDGFTGGSTCRRDWVAAGNSMLIRTHEPRGKTWADVTRYRPHVRLHKVHGSINWLQDEHEDRLLRCDRSTDVDAPVGWRRAMITPGRSKLAEAGVKRDWFTEADNAIGAAHAFLIVGYGFNDDHIQKRMRTKLADQGCPGIVVTRDWTERIKDWIRQSSDLWAVCRNPSGDNTGSIIAGPANVDAPLECYDRNIWDIASFSDAVM